MLKTILIPTDFSIESLNTLKLAMKNNSHKVNVVLMFPVVLSNSIQDLLFYSAQKMISTMAHDEFNEGLAILQNRHENQIENVRIELFHGYTLNALKQFLVANRIDELFIPQTYKLRLAKNTNDPLPALKKCGLPCTEINWETRDSLTITKGLDFLFSSNR